jgi:heme-degrading monooxygenase HmoA
MFARLLEFTAKQGNATEVTSALNDKVMPMVENLPGFVDAIVLTSTAEPERLVGLSFWKTQEDAERYAREHYPMVLEALRQVLATAPRVQTFNVDIFASHKIAAGKAA